MLLQLLRASAPHQHEAVKDRFRHPFPISNNILLKEKGENKRAKPWAGSPRPLEEQAANIPLSILLP